MKSQQQSHKTSDGDPDDLSEAGSAVKSEMESEVKVQPEVGSEAASYMELEVRSVRSGGFACSEHVTISNGLHFVDAEFVHQAVKGVVQIGQHEEDLHCRHGGGHGAETHNVTEQDDHMLVRVPNDLMAVLQARTVILKGNPKLISFQKKGNKN